MEDDKRFFKWFSSTKRFNSWRFLNIYWGSKETGGGTLSTTGWSKWGRNVASGWLCVGHAEIADLGLDYFYFHRWPWRVDHVFQLACRCCESSFLSEFLMNSLSVRKCLPCYAFRRKQKAEADKRISTQQPSVYSRMQWLQVIQLIGGKVYFINDACPRQFCQSFVKSRLLTAFYMAAGEIRHYIHPQHGCKTRNVDALTRALQRKKLMGENQKKPCEISTPWDFFLGPLRWWRHLFGAWRDLLSIKELMTWAGTSLHKEAITVIVIHLFPSRPSEIQEVLSQVKVRNGFFCPVWRDRSILYTHIWGHCYYEYVEYKQMHETVASLLNPRCNISHEVVGWELLAARCSSDLHGRHIWCWWVGRANTKRGDQNITNSKKGLAIQANPLRQCSHSVATGPSTSSMPWL